jgi:hypothetical protein
MLFREVIGIYCGNRAKHKTTVWQNAGFVIVKAYGTYKLNWNGSSIFSPGRQPL